MPYIYIFVSCAGLSPCSQVRLFATLWTIAHQAPLSTGFSRQEYGVGCHALLQGIFLTQKSNPSLTSPLAGGLFTTATWEDLYIHIYNVIHHDNKFKPIARIYSLNILYSNQRSIHRRLVLVEAHHLRFRLEVPNSVMIDTNRIRCPSPVFRVFFSSYLYISYGFSM